MGLGIGLAIAAGLLAVAAKRVADPSALWHIVNERCVPHQQQAGDPAPCAQVDLAQGVERGYAVLKDLVGATQFLLIPTARIGGIESPGVLAPDAPNYWAAAWTARRFVQERAHAALPRDMISTALPRDVISTASPPDMISTASPRSITSTALPREMIATASPRHIVSTALPRDMISLAINSAVGRTQDQLHIHIDCVRADVRAALAAHRDSLGPGWSAFPVPLAGHPYRAMRLDGDTLDAADPFRLLADSDPPTAADMGRHTLVVVGMMFAGQTPGFAILDDRVDLLRANLASGEELQDHECLVARER